MIVLDVSASMGLEIAVLADELGSSTTELSGDLRVGLAVFSDYPILPYGSPIDTPFERSRGLHRADTALPELLSDVTTLGGGDAATSAVPALTFVLEELGGPCDRDASACWRFDASRLVVLLSDGLFHNGPDGADAYRDGVGSLAGTTYSELLDTVLASRIAIAAISTGSPEESAHMRQLVEETASVTSEGELRFSMVDQSTVPSALLNELELGASRYHDLVNLVITDDYADAVDVAALVIGIRAVRSDPEPGAIEAGEAFLSALTGTRLTFEVDLETSETLTGGRYPFDARLVDGSGSQLEIGSFALDVVEEDECLGTRDKP